MWNECVTHCNAVIAHAEASGDYGLEADVNAPFITANENSKEIIFALPESHCSDDSLYHGHTQTFPTGNRHQHQTHQLTGLPLHKQYM